MSTSVFTKSVTGAPVALARTWMVAKKSLLDDGAAVEEHELRAKPRAMVRTSVV